MKRSRKKGDPIWQLNLKPMSIRPELPRMTRSAPRNRSPFPPMASISTPLRFNHPLLRLQALHQQNLRIFMSVVQHRKLMSTMRYHLVDPLLTKCSSLGPQTYLA
jgi:hypothetical protein